MVTTDQSASIPSAASAEPQPLSLPPGVLDQLVAQVADEVTRRLSPLEDTSTTSVSSASVSSALSEVSLVSTSPAPTSAVPVPGTSVTPPGMAGAIVWGSLRGSDCKYRESADKLKKSKILITCQKNTFGELSSKILLKPSGILLFSGNSEKRFCLIYYAIIRLKIKEIESACF